MSGDTSSINSFSSDFINVLKSRQKILNSIRKFFDIRDYLEVETPVMVKCPGIDPYIEPIISGDGYYLATSPELHMKRLLSAGFDKIYQITRSFRSEESGALHNNEFTMLEWYRAGSDYLDIMIETEVLIRQLCGSDIIDKNRFTFPFKKITVDELFNKVAGWEPSCNWDEDRYFRDWAEKIDPYLKTIDAVFILDFPAPLSALSKLKEDNSLVCERFELYLYGVEIANAYSELTGLSEHELCFKNALKRRQNLGKQIYDIDTGFMDAVKKGIPESGGVALGIDRLVMVLLEKTRIEDVIAFPENRL
jgi:lysyl-tRNA synthetase class 2